MKLDKYKPIFNEIEEFTKSNLIDQKFNIISKHLPLSYSGEHELSELYKIVLPSFEPKIKTTTLIFENSYYNVIEFKYLYNISERVYNNWIQNSKSCYAYECYENTIKVKYDEINEVYQVFLKWKRSFDLNANDLQEWFKKIGIIVSITTCTYLLEFGMPYNGDILPPKFLFVETANGVGIIGLLAYQLNLLIRLNKNSSVNLFYHPLKQSIVLALARIEFILNPTLI